MAEEQTTDMYDVLEALEAVITAAPKTERDALAEVMDSYAKDCADDYWWSVGPQSPTLLHHLINTIEFAMADVVPKRERVVRLAARKPEGDH